MARATARSRLRVDGSFTYRPAAGFSGTDAFTYRARLGVAASAPAQVRIVVNGAPVAVADRYAVAAGGAAPRRAARRAGQRP